tara:strand:+ start:248 stop:415 length:168 start_codon:yes stop_codon:yes gene_type:complete
MTRDELIEEQNRLTKSLRKLTVKQDKTQLQNRISPASIVMNRLVKIHNRLKECKE